VDPRNVGQVTYEACIGWRGQTVQPGPVICPPALKYPTPPDAVEILFVGWNPPSEDHFWEGRKDELRDNLEWVFSRSGWGGPQEDFREDFLQRHCYLVHAVKCWRDSGWPSAETTSRCSALLAQDLDRLKPKALCLLGQRAHLAASLLPALAGLPPVSPAFRYWKGWTGRIGGKEIVITTFPNGRWNRSTKTENRECTASTLGLKFVMKGDRITVP
jgi:uracil-DNA glycosylase